MHAIKEYESIIGAQAIEDLHLLAEKVRPWKIQNINSTSVGGGVAEILHHMIPLFNELGVNVTWDVIKGGDKFYKVTKKFHNALHGRLEEILPEDFTVFNETNLMNSNTMELTGDIMFIHDPQPAGLILQKKNPDAKWIWRCHIDVSNPDPRVWNFLRPFIDRYDAGIFSAPAFSQELPIRQFFIPPSIDPLSDKNKTLPPETIEKVLEKFHLDLDKP